MDLEKELSKTHEQFNVRYGYRSLETYADLLEMQLKEMREHLDNNDEQKAVNEFIDAMSISYDAIVDHTHTRAKDNIVLGVD